jgi:methylmalonyl-CoA epimerase
MCKRVLIAVAMLVVLGVITVACTLAEKSEPVAVAASESLNTQRVTQIAVIVRDVEKTAKAWADLFGIEVPQASLTDPPEKAHTLYRGKPTEGRAKLIFFKMDNLQLELIEPVGGPSTWQEFLDTKGEGIHHIAFEVKGMDEQIAKLEKKGMPLIQRGEWTAYTGGCYTYFDSLQQLGVILELLENY